MELWEALAELCDDVVLDGALEQMVPPDLRVPVEKHWQRDEHGEEEDQGRPHGQLPPAHSRVDRSGGGEGAVGNG